MDAASNNPWAQPLPQDARRTALGGIRAFVQRNALDTPEVLQAASSSSSTYSSMQLIRGLGELLAKKSSVLSLTRTLEQLEREVASAGCMLPHQLQLRIDSAAALRSQLHELLELKPVLLHTLRKSASSESITIETEHQRAFIELFEKIGAELPRYTHVLNTLDGIDLVASDLAARQREFEHVVADLAVVIAAYDALCQDIARLRDVYSLLQSEAAAAPAPSSDDTLT